MHLWVVRETHEQWRHRIFILNLSFPFVVGFPVFMLHIWTGITVRVHCKGEMYVTLGQKPGQGHRNILVWWGLEVFLHLALSEKLSKSSHL